MLRALVIYLILMLLFRMTGKRSMAQVTTFDFVLLLLVGEATQQALLGEDFSIVNAALVIATLFGLDRASDFLGWRLPFFNRVTESVPLVLVHDGRALDNALAKEHLSEDDILGAARQSQGLERMDQIKWAVLEPSGAISIVPKSGGPVT
ncbi:DUF421 domain-containing protein [Microbacterium sp. A93]|uniref:DUF421 domain-containing protein n=1 Tax=Microbacterium sp. A93 TaxID=3450716 RepID=UPI003F43B013